MQIEPKTHPLFTGRCPRCELPMETGDRVHYDGPECGWVDDSV